MGKLRDWMRERIPGIDKPSATIVGGPSIAHVFGWVLVMLLLVEAVTGATLAAFYSPSGTSAWASVAYVQDRMPLGWFVRGLHFHGSSALVIVTGAHLAQTALYGAYRRPREVVWWLGILLLLLVLGFTVTGYVLRWDQAGYWANHVEMHIAASTPLIGDLIQRIAVGGNDWGNLTLTRFYGLHIAVLPAVTVLVVGGHVWIARKHGATPRVDGLPAVPRWPAQSVRNVAAMAATFAALLVYVVHMHGADLTAPADPSSAYDARPLWYFRWLFELRQLAGSAEAFVALFVPAIVAGFLVMLPRLDRAPDRGWRGRRRLLGGVAGVLAVIGGLTIASVVGDARDHGLAKREKEADEQASRARELAMKYGVPATGPHDVGTNAPMHHARELFAQRCKGCHDADSKDRKGPIITFGHGGREWVRGFLQHPSGPEYWGKSKFGQTKDAMRPVELSATELDDLVELLYAQTGATDIDAAKRDRGKGIFDKACTDCHSIDEGVAGTSAPDLYGVGSRDYYTSFIGNPKSAIHMSTDKSEMPRFDKDMPIVDRDALAEYLVWLRTATPKDLEALGPL
jgi:ubiquinol-cytochrome c reductase cytochrome b subunit